MSNRLFKNATRIYQKGVFRVLPLSLLITAIYFFIAFSQPLFPSTLRPMIFQIALFAGILLAPLMGALFYQMQKIGENQKISGYQLFIYTCQRFLSLMGCLISMILLPAIMLAICVIIYITMGIYQFPWIALFAWEGFSYLAVFAAITSKILAPILVFTEKADANSAIDNSEALAKKHFFYTYLYSFFAIALLVFWHKFPQLLAYYHPQLRFSPFEAALISCCLMLFLGPWSFAILLALKEELKTKNK